MQTQHLTDREPQARDSDELQRPMTAPLPFRMDCATTHKLIGLPLSLAAHSAELTHSFDFVQTSPLKHAASPQPESLPSIHACPDHPFDLATTYSRTLFCHASVLDSAQGTRPYLMPCHCTLPPTFHHSLSHLETPIRCCAILLDSSPPILNVPRISHIISSILTQEGQILNPPGGVRVVRALSSESDSVTHSTSPRVRTALMSSTTVACDTNATNSPSSLLHPHRSPRPCFLAAATPCPSRPFPCLPIASPCSPQTMPTSPLLPGAHHKSAPPWLLSAVCHARRAQHLTHRPSLVDTFSSGHLAVLGFIHSVLICFHLSFFSLDLLPHSLANRCCQFYILSNNNAGEKKWTQALLSVRTILL